MLEFITATLSSYIITLVLVKGSIFEKTRETIKRRTPWLQFANHPHFVDCRLCISFWSSVLVCHNNYTLIVPVYGLAYFLATQERK